MRLAMRYLYLLYAGLLLLAACRNQNPNTPAAPTEPGAPPAPTPNFAGAWEWNGNSEEASFTVTITERGDSLVGSYCAVARGGSKIDCADTDGGPARSSFTMPRPNGNTLETDFKTYFSGETGRVRLTLADNDRLRWEIAEVPKGEFYALPDAELRRTTRLTLHVEPDGIVRLGGRAVRAEQVESMLTDTIRHIRSLTGRLPDTIEIVEADQVPPRTSIIIKGIVDQAKAAASQ
jgi:hypothetical protein